MRRYLFGPVSKTFADQNLHRQRQAGECLAFDPDGTTDLAIGPEDTWAQACARLPAGWRPDFIVLYLPYSHIPSCLWQVSVPLVGLALDWPLLWHYYRRRLRSLDWVLTWPAKESCTPAPPTCKAASGDSSANRRGGEREKGRKNERKKEQMATIPSSPPRRVPPSPPLRLATAKCPFITLPKI